MNSHENKNHRLNSRQQSARAGCRYKLFSFPGIKLNFICITSVFLLHLLFFAAPAAAVKYDNFRNEPEVRIGIVQKTNNARLSFNGDFTIFKLPDNGDSPLELYSGSDETIQVELYNVHLQQLPDQFIVTLGSFRSFEQAEFFVGRLSSVPAVPAIFQPKQWSIKFGPFKTRIQAEFIENIIRRLGYEAVRIQPVDQDIHVLTLYDRKGEFIHLGNTPVVFYPHDGRFRVGYREYRGNAEVVLDSYGTFSVINRVRVEDYLYSVLPREMPASANIEALKSQAVIARTYLLNNLRRHVADHFNLCNTTDCQVYGGVRNETPATTEAVDLTRGETLTNGSNLINALFCSTCGGRTAAFNDAWSGAALPSLSSVDDGTEFSITDLSNPANLRKFLAHDKAFCNKSRYHRWTKTYTYDQLRKLFEESIPEFTNNPDLEIGTLKDINVTKYSKSGRAQLLVIETTKGNYTFEKDQIRWVMGMLKSTMFVIDKEGSGTGRKFILKGGGWGHGVGLCQTGAMEMAKENYTYDQILLHYYPGAELKRIWE